MLHIEKKFTDLTSQEAYNFFLIGENYSKINLPPYFTFSPILHITSDLLSDVQALEDIVKKNSKSTPCWPSNYADINYVIIDNKDSKFSWRPFQLINPVLYVMLVKTVTNANAWSQIIKRLRKKEGSKIICTSLPTIAQKDANHAIQQRNQYYEDFEQKSLQLSLDYDCVATTDIANCYATIYTHSIAWALHGKDVSKTKKRDKNLLGNKIDLLLREMSYGQTNGIPQGSVLMDIIAEIVLAYADELLEEKIKNINCTILRYRDDYRIFTQDNTTAKTILQELSTVLQTLNLQLNSHKTYVSEDVISASIKADKLAWLEKNINDSDIERTFQINFQKKLLQIYMFSLLFPNSGAVQTLLSDFYKELVQQEHIYNSVELLGIITAMSENNPKSCSILAAIIGKLINSLADQERKKEVVCKLCNKLNTRYHTSYMSIWLQRISYSIDPTIEYNEKLCKLVCGENAGIWNFTWLKDAFASKLNRTSIIDCFELDNLSTLITSDEICIDDYGDIIDTSIDAFAGVDENSADSLAC